MAEICHHSLRPKGGAHAPVAPPLATALQLTPLDCIYFINDLVIIKIK